MASTAREVAGGTRTAPGSAGRRGRTILLGLLLSALTVAAFWNVGRCQFASIDDQPVVSANPRVVEGLTPGAAWWAFTTLHLSNWVPLTWLSHLLDVSLFGLRPAGHHLVSLGWHVATSVLLAVLLQALTGAAGRSFLVAALFAVHPLHVESVAWVTERRDLLCAFFWLLALAVYCRSLRRDGRPRAALVFVPFLLALMSKPMAVTLPVSLLILDYWPLGRLRAPACPARAGWSRLGAARALVFEKTLLFALAIADGLLALVAQRSSGALRSLAELPFPARMENALVAYAAYLRKTFWPLDLAVFYPHPGTSLPLWKAATAGCVLLGVSAWAFRVRRSRPYVAAGWLWYLVVLAPVTSFWQAGLQAYADRFTYVALVGIFLAAVWYGEEASRRVGLRAPAGLAAAALLVVLFPLTRRQVDTWRDGVTLGEHALKVTGENFMARGIVGNALLERGQVADALVHLEKAVAVNPGYARHWHSLGIARERLGDRSGAVAAYRRALELNPRLVEAANNLATILSDAGRLAEALAQLEAAVAMRPEYEKGWYNLGLVRERRGDAPGAAAAYRRAISINPRAAPARFALALALLGAGDKDGARAQYDQLRAIDAGWGRKLEPFIRAVGAPR